MAVPDALELGGDPGVGWLRRRDRATDGELATQRREADARLVSALERRDAEQRKLREEHKTLVVPMRQERQSNHFADMIRASMRRMTQAHDAG